MRPCRYCLEQCRLPGSDWITIQSDLDKETTLVSEFDPLKDYMYRVKAYNDAGFSDATNSTSVFARNRECLWRTAWRHLVLSWCSSALRAHN